jgi:hypothetical protein
MSRITEEKTQLILTFTDEKFTWKIARLNCDMISWNLPQKARCNPLQFDGTVHLSILKRDFANVSDRWPFATWAFLTVQRSCRFAWTIHMRFRTFRSVYKSCSNKNGFQTLRNTVFLMEIFNDSILNKTKLEPKNSISF